MVTAELFVGVEAHDQQSLEFAGFKGLAPFELAVDPPSRPAQLGRVQALADVAEGVVADRSP